MAQAQTILPQDPQFPEWLNFEFLRTKGREHLGNLSGDLWTDHNTHDPGITILEVLCYALTDLGYRNQFDIEDIFARPFSDRQLDAPDDNFYAPAEILSVNPLTLRDYQKLLLDMPGIRRAWLVPRTTEGQELPIYFDTTPPANGSLDIAKTKKLSFTPLSGALKIKGLYDVYIDLDEETPQYSTPKTTNNIAIISAVKKRLMAHRNLCEDFFYINIVEKQKLTLCVELELTPEAVPEDVIVAIFEAIQEFLTPTIRFYTLQEMLEKGKTIDDIFDGRPLSLDSFGFIDSDDLGKLDPIDNLHLSDIYRIMMNIEGVRTVKDLKISGGNINSNDWLILLDKTKSPLIDVINSTVIYSKGSLPLTSDRALINRKLTQHLTNKSKIKRNAYELGFSFPQGTVRDFADYTSIQNDFPVVYGVGDGDIPLSAGAVRLRQALQLKGYLAFFDQILANYLMQLANVRRLFALRPKTEGELKTSYFSQAVASMPNADKIIRFFDKTTEPNLLIGEKDSPTFYKTQSLARLQSENPLTNRHWRNALIGFFQQAFDADTVEFKLTDAWEKDPKVPECDRFTYEWVLASSKAVLKSLYNFKTEQDARNDAETVKYLGILPESYRLDDDTTTPQYGFELIYNPLTYKAYLDRIAETPEVFDRRRNGFLNHLLARFAEQFTEYTLLMFALNGKTKTQTDINSDKSRFLSRYDNLSRNRSRGFNYNDTDNVWNTTNTSGFEQRVAGYMGLDDWRRRTLNHFKIVKSEQYWLLEWYERAHNCLIFTTNIPPINTKEEQTIKNGFDYMVAVFLRPSTVIVPTGCAQEGLFSFKIWDDDLNTYWEHPPQYPTAFERDAALSFWQNYFQNNHFVVKATTEKEGFRCILTDPNSQLIWLQSTMVYKTKAEATTDFWQMILLAFDEKNYTHIKDAEGNHYVTLRNAALDTDSKEASPIAEHLSHYESKGISLEIADAVWTHVRQKYVRFNTAQTEDYLDWQIADEKAHTLIYSLVHFETKAMEQALASLWEARIAAGQYHNWRIIFDEERCVYYFQLVQPNADIRLFLDKQLTGNYIPVARSVAEYKTENEAEMGLEKAKAALQNPVWLDRCILKSVEKEVETIDKKGKKHCHTEGVFSFRLFLPNSTTPLMVSRKVSEYHGLGDASRAKIAATVAFVKFLTLAVDSKNYTKIKVDANDFRFEIETQGISAISFDSYSTDVARDAALTALIENVKKATSDNGWLNPIRHYKGSYFTQILDDNGQNALLIGTERYASEALLWADLPLFLASFEPQKKQIDNGDWVADTETGIVAVDTRYESGAKTYSLELRHKLANGDLKTWATVPEYFEKKEGRDTLFTLFVNRRPKEPSNTLIEVEKYRFCVQLMDCHNVISTVLTSKNLFLNAENAIEAGLLYRKNLVESCPTPVDTGVKADKKGKTAQSIVQANSHIAPNGNPAAIPTFFDYAGDDKKGIVAWHLCDNKKTIVAESVVYSKDEAEKLKDALQKNFSSENTLTFSKDTKLAISQAEGQNSSVQKFVSVPLLQPIQADNEGDNEAELAVDKDIVLKKMNDANRYRLRDESYRLAHYYRFFSNQAEQAAAVAEFAKYWQRAIRIFPIINAIGTGKQSAIFKGDNYYYRFSITCGGEAISLRTAQLYGSEEEAEEKNGSDAMRLDFIKRLLDYDAYEIVCKRNPINKEEAAMLPDVLGKEEGWRVQIVDYTPLKPNCDNLNPELIRPILVVGHIFKTEQKARQAMKCLMDWAKEYPIFKNDDGQIQFQLINKTIGNAEWLSDNVYPDITTAEADFYEMVRLLDYTPNILQTEKPFGLVVGEVLLECKEDFTYHDANDMMCCHIFDNTVQKVWRLGVETLLSRVFLPDAVVIVPETKAVDCSYAIKVVDTGYHVAKHTHYYDNPSMRAKAYALLTCKNCCNQPYAFPPSIVGQIVETKKEIGEQKLIITTAEYTIDLTTTLSWHMPIGKKEGTSTLFIEKDSDTYLYTRFLPWAEHVVFYDSPLPFVVYEKETKKELVENKWVDVCKTSTKIGETHYWLRLLDENGHEMAVSSIFKSEEERQNALKQTLLRARQHPIKPIRPIAPDTTMRYMVKIYDDSWTLTHVDTTINGDYIWQAIDVFESPKAAHTFINSKMSDALMHCDIIGTQADNCGDFSLALVNNRAIIACHPTLFDTRGTAQLGVERILKAVDTEGFHVVENILLRPKTQLDITKPNADEALLSPDAQLIACWNDPYLLAQNLKIGIDPYSAQVTVVLPAWARRFQNEAFRKFFENTLRRELPAHCTLTTYWLDPQNLRKFEQRYRTWLMGLAHGMPEEEDLKKELVTLLPTLKDYYAPIILNQADQFAYLNNAKLL
jgi:hypothetical protein